MKLFGDNITSIAFGQNINQIGNPEEEVVASGVLPPITTGLEFFFNPDIDIYSDAGSTPAVDLDGVYQANDQSGAGIIFTQATGANQLTYNADGLGVGNNSLLKDSTAEWMDMDSTISFTNAESFAFHTVVKRLAVSEGIAYLTDPSTGAGTNRILDWSSGTIYFSDAVGNGATMSVTQTTNLEFRSYVLDRTNSLCRTYVNGTEVATASSTGLTSGFSFDRIFNRSGGSANGRADFGYQLLYRGLQGPSDITTLWNWANDKYNIVA